MTQTIQLNDVDLPAVGALAQSIADDPTNAHTTWSARVSWRGGFRSEGTVREFPAIPSDEPSGLGGTDTAPNPVEQLLAAFGHCLAVGYAANASTRGIELRDLTVEVDGDLDLSVFLGLAEGHAGFSTIRASVTIDADATSTEIEELHRAVTGTSPVGHTLASTIPVDIQLTGGA